MKKVVIIVLCCLMSLSVLNGCKNEIDETKTQLYVGIYDGGIGTDSIYSLASRFEEKYNDISFEPGKMGVQIKVRPSRSYDPTMIDTISGLTEEVFIGTSASANYFAKKGLLLDITEAINTPLNQDLITGEVDESVESVAIKDKVRKDLKYHFVNEEDNKYYGFAGATTFYGLTYDIDLFESENLYFAKGGGFVSSKTDARSAGPDGNEATAFDNGLPATYDDFFALCDRIVSKKMTPVMWGGTVQEYMSSLLRALSVDCDGKEEAELNYSYEGTSKALITGFNGNTPIINTAGEKISAPQGYKLYAQQGRYYALKFLERLTSNKDYYNSADATSTSFAHTSAQDEYLFSKHPGTRKRTAMLVDGNWWQSEARGTFFDLAAEYGEEDSIFSRNFGMMPLPKPTAEKVGEPFTVLEMAVGDSFVRANIADYKINLAKQFIKFMHTDVSLTEYIRINGVCMPYTLDAQNSLYEFTPWGRSMYQLSENAIIATQNSKSKIMQNYATDLWYSPELWKSKIGGTTYTYPSYAMIDDSISARQYFDGLKDNWTESTWQNKFKDV